MLSHPWLYIPSSFGYLQLHDAWPMSHNAFMVRNGVTLPCWDTHSLPLSGYERGLNPFGERCSECLAHAYGV